MRFAFSFFVLGAVAIACGSRPTVPDLAFEVGGLVCERLKECASSTPCSSEAFRKNLAVSGQDALHVLCTDAEIATCKGDARFLTCADAEKVISFLDPNEIPSCQRCFRRAST